MCEEAAPCTRSEEESLLSHPQKNVCERLQQKPPKKKALDLFFLLFFEWVLGLAFLRGPVPLSLVLSLKEPRTHTLT